jgi:hypothetical protein
MSAQNIIENEWTGIMQLELPLKTERRKDGVRLPYATTPTGVEFIPE